MNAVYEATNEKITIICSRNDSPLKAMKQAIKHYEKMLRKNEYIYPLAMNIQLVDSIEPYYSISLIVWKLVD